MGITHQLSSANTSLKNTNLLPKTHQFRLITNLSTRKPPGKPAPNYYGDTTSASSGEQALDDLDEFPSTGGLHNASSDEDNKLPSTKGDIKALLCNIRMLFAADVAVLREDIHTVEGRVKKTEEASQGLTARCTQLEAQNAELQRSQALLAARMDTVEDPNRSRNIKIQGVPDSISQDTLAQFIGRLLTSLLTPQQVKTIGIDGMYRITRATKTPADTPRDAILQLQMRSAQLTLMVRGRNTYPFKKATLSFFRDLSRPTLIWRSLLKPLTTALHQHAIPYRWASPRSLIITQGGAITRVTDPSEMDTVLTALDLSPQQEHATPAQGPQTPHTWDIANIRPFHPEGPTTTSSMAYKAQRANRQPTGT
ncbi:Hypothetical predicted protein [Pelobates cultripes]|uniref:Uncharacterized protein n=1 Tax=Pelobates cultripes TaxID=61616 RepID=A0AAD1SGN3_PELCU|nr:Hypothetical predicted protein [Pelobates cultripes]